MTQVPASSHGGSLPSQWTADSHGGLTITVDDANTVPLTLKGAAGQVSHMLDLLTSVSGALLNVQPSGDVNIGTAAQLNDAAWNGGDTAFRIGDFQAAAATGSTLKARSSDGTIKWKIAAEGAQRILTHAAPADDDLNAGECALWFDQTNGAAATKLMVKGKSADGTVKTAAIVLA